MSSCVRVTGCFALVDCVAESLSNVSWSKVSGQKKYTWCVIFLAFSSVLCEMSWSDAFRHISVTGLVWGMISLFTRVNYLVVFLSCLFFLSLDCIFLTREARRGEVKRKERKEKKEKKPLHVSVASIKVKFALHSCSQGNISSHLSQLEGCNLLMTKCSSVSFIEYASIRKRRLWFHWRINSSVCMHLHLFVCYF